MWAVGGCVVIRLVRHTIGLRGTSQHEVAMPEPNELDRNQTLFYPSQTCPHLTSLSPNKTRYTACWLCLMLCPQGWQSPGFPVSAASSSSSSSLSSCSSSSYSFGSGYDSSPLPGERPPLHARAQQHRIQIQQQQKEQQEEREQAKRWIGLLNAQYTQACMLTAGVEYTG